MIEVLDSVKNDCMTSIRVHIEISSRMKILNAVGKSFMAQFSEDVGNFSNFFLITDFNIYV
jgi:hypothetical protein